MTGPFGTDSTQPAPFNPVGELPGPGTTTLLEASAGTGKTHTIAALAARLIAEEGVAAQHLLIVTFTRFATAELRERIRSRLSDTLSLLESAGADDGETASVAGTAEPIDDVDRLIVALPRESAIANLRRALRDFDAATISTVHQFCSHAMRELGILGDADPREELTEVLEPLIATATADTYLQMAGSPSFDLSPKDAAARASSAITDAQSSLDQDLLPLPDQDPDRAQEFARRARDRGEWIRRRDGLVTYDDQILRLKGVIDGSPAAAQAADVLREAHRIVLVDEFQDTDEAQWAVLETVFHGHARLVLIGDPKQAIYGFRGGDVHTYARAAAKAGRKFTLATNYRSDSQVLDGVNLLFADRFLGTNPPIRGERVAARHTRRRLLNGSGEPTAAFRGRVLERVDKLDPLRDHIAQDTAEQITALLAGSWTLAQGTATDSRPVSAADITVLTRKRKQGQLIVDALTARGVPCREQSADSVMRDQAARDWLTLLRALAEPGWPARANSAALALLGGRPSKLAGDSDAFAEKHGARVRDLGAIMDSRGFPALAAAVLADGTAMAAIGDDRRLADLRHIAEILGAQQRATGMPVAALAQWLSTQITGADSTHLPRLETQDPAVTVMTVHAAKGLQFPIVFVPYAWEAPYPGDHGRPARIHIGQHRVLDRRIKCDGLKESQAIAAAEEDDEEMRLLYVALTRAANQVVWHWAWAGRGRTANSALHRMLSAAAAGHETPAAKYGKDGWHAWADGRAEMTIEQVPPSVPVTQAPPGRPRSQVSAASFTRVVDTVWGRRSYSSLTHTAHAAEPPLRVTADEPDAAPSPTGPRDSPAPAAARPSPWSDLPGGAGFGTMVHAVLEATSGDDMARLADNCAEAVRRYRVAGVSGQALARVLRSAMSTPLGDLLGGKDLAAFGQRDRAAELDFDIALDTRPGRDKPATVADVADLLRQELPSDSPLADYPDRLLDLPGGAGLRGFLTGSIDAVLRWRSDAGDRYVVVDHKTNWLGPPRDSGLPLTTWHYRPEAMAEAMMAAHYPLQALLYNVALHRLLRWRLGPAYDPERALGGVAYLFLRGMVGPDTPAGTGVFSWKPSAALVTRTSDLLSGIRNPRTEPANAGGPPGAGVVLAKASHSDGASGGSR